LGGHILLKRNKKTKERSPLFKLNLEEVKVTKKTFINGRYYIDIHVRCFIYGW